MAKKQLLWGYPKGVQERISQKETPTHRRRGLMGCISRQDLVLSYSRNAVLSRKKLQIASFLFLLLTCRYIIGILGLWG